MTNVQGINVSPTINDEKYISIPYERWDTYYKQLENKYTQLLKDFEREKESKTFKIHLYTSHHYNDNFRYTTISLSRTDHNWEIIDDKELKGIVESLMNNSNEYYTGPYGTYGGRYELFNVEKIKEYIQQYEEERKKTEEQIDKLANIYRKLPFWIKPFFNRKMKEYEKKKNMEKNVQE